MQRSNISVHRVHGTKHLLGRKLFNTAIGITIMKPILRKRLSAIIIPLLIAIGRLHADESIDYAALLPRIKPVEPVDAVETFEVQPGFRIELVASEPLIADPVEMMFDERGRLWVLEFRQYNQEYNGGDLSVRGSLKVLEDIDRDGVMDKATTFADNLDYASAFHVWKGGVFLGMTPDILYLKDSDGDGDGEADRREVVFTGFAKDVNRAGQAQMNSFRWGFDNRIHVCTNSGGSVGRPVGEGRPVSVRQRGFTFDPVDRSYDVRSGGGQHGMTFDQWGNQFNCQSSRPCQYLFYDSRYLKNNPWMPAASPSVLISRSVVNHRVYTISPAEPWRIVRNKMRSEGRFRGSADVRHGKIVNHGYFTAASGLTSYVGDAFPPQYLHNTFLGETANNIVYRAETVRDGVGFVSQRADTDVQREFLASTDNWFRPVQFANGPDGALYVVDMYREIIEGGAFLPPEIMKHLNMASGDDRGRIYRVLPEGSETKPLPDISGYSTSQLIELLSHPNGWHRDTAARLLCERQDSSTAATLRKFAETTSSALGGTRARYLLESLGAFDVALARAALREANSDALIHSLRLADRVIAAVQAERKGDTSLIAIQNRIVELADHEEPAVRYQALFSMSGFSHPRKADVLTKQLSREFDDKWMRLAAVSGVADVLVPVCSELLSDAEFLKSESAPTVLGELVDITSRSGKSDAIGELGQLLVNPQGDDTRFGDTLFRRLLTSCTATKRSELLASGNEAITARFAAMLTQSRDVAFDEQRDANTRARHLPLLEMALFDDVAESLTVLLQPDQPDTLQKAALSVLSRFNEPQVGTILIEAWPGLSPALRSQTSEVLFGRSTWTLATLDAVQQGTITRGEVGSIRITTLRKHSNKKIADKAQVVFGDGSSDEARAAVVRRYREALSADGDASRGKAVFAKSCSACHRLEKVGKAVGPNLLGIGKVGREAIMLNVLDPNRDVKAQYVNYTLLDFEGVAHSGMIQAESTNSITLQRLDGSSVDVLRVEIELLKSSGVSFMPVGLDTDINVQQMRDLLSYLESVN